MCRHRPKLLAIMLTLPLAGCEAPTRVLRILQDGRIDVAAGGLNGPVTDLLWHDGRLYISHRGKISALGARRGSGHWAAEPG